MVMEKQSETVYQLHESPNISLHFSIGIFSISVSTLSNKQISFHLHKLSLSP